MIWLSLGSNLGNREENLSTAVRLLKERAMPDAVCSPVMETKAIVPEGAPASWDIPYLNAVVCGTRAPAPEDLLKALKGIEREMGRPEVYEKWSPRLIDIDILLYDDRTIALPHLQIPHPQLPNRPFFRQLMEKMEKRSPVLPSPRP
jgi:2-amino-4-hydroxy-6-hydroxymethyldihydropteridine diphosphokinase/dihydropteroate synthase